ncbi:ATP-dependent endonuclease [Kitasatospora sp. NPDC048407]|uniref:ATP-dependent nuclease n=1 Tax=Kitasatospora sp. NPDC048407 TaxID=3364051 RepID=UPI003723814B
MSVAFNVADLILKDGTVVNPPADGMTVFIGPNNSGKSMLLRELAASLTASPELALPEGRWIATTRIQSSGSAQEFVEWLRARGEEPRPNPQTGEPIYAMHAGAPAEGPIELQVRNSWDNRAFARIAHFLVAQQGTQERLSNQTDSQLWDSAFPPAHPTQHLFDNREAHHRFSELVRSAFGEPIALNRYEQHIRLQVGDTGMEDEVPPISSELRQAYHRLPAVNEQGDGFRSFVNLLLHTLARPRPVIVIDEPEAFLHPPQARLLGRYLAELPPSPCQVFVATHSSDFVSGILEAAQRPVSLVRISRTASGPRARVLEPEAVAEILRTPVLRYSNIISGLFHDGVVLGESEGDCQFYAATFDTVMKGRPNSNLVFLHTSGKAKLADTARRLRQCGIPVAIVADLDFLNDRNLLKRALAALGGEFAAIEPDLKVLEDTVNSTVTVTSAPQIKKQINEILGDPRNGDALTTEQRTNITALLKSSGGWPQLKKAGMPALGSGEPYAAVLRLTDYFARLGVFLVPVGELEGWVRQVPSANKSRWLTDVFEGRHHLHPSVELGDFCSKVDTYLASCR